MSGAIPARGHFIWFGSSFPWVNELAIRSCLERSELEQVILHHDQSLDPARLESLRKLPGFEARLIDGPALFRRARPERAAELSELFEALERPNARANLSRAAILADEGGIYLDMDTVTLSSLRPLLADGAFCGEEHVAWPGRVKQSRRLDWWAAALLRDGVRFGLAHLPSGWKPFRAVAGGYPTAANNAVLGASPGHPFMVRLLDAMLELPKARRTVAYALGTHLLQAELAKNPGGVRIHPPEAFYPLGPEISRQWFRVGPAPDLEGVLGTGCRLVHWYASVHTRKIVPRIDPAYVRAHADEQLFSALARPFLPGRGAP